MWKNKKVRLWWVELKRILKDGYLDIILNEVKLHLYIGDGSCSYGLKDSDDIAMYEWNGTILGPPHSAFENRIFSLSIYCGDNYPDVPPLVKFESRISLPCVNQQGLVDFSRISSISRWNRNFTLETVLVELRRDMASPANRKSSQPPEGVDFPPLDLRALAQQRGL